MPQNASYLVGGIHFIVINHALIFKKLTLNHLLKGTEKPHSKELCQNQSSNMSCITEAISKVEQTRDMKNVEKASFKVTHFLFALASLRSQNFLLDRFFYFFAAELSSVYWSSHTHIHLTASRSSYAQTVRLAHEWKKGQTSRLLRRIFVKEVTSRILLQQGNLEEKEFSVGSRSLSAKSQPKFSSLNS